jgi:hypothetical protein
MVHRGGESGASTAGRANLFPAPREKTRRVSCTYFKKIMLQALKICARQKQPL